MKMNSTLLVALCALLCLQGCWCSKRKCCKNECAIEQVEQLSKSTEVAKNDVRDTIDAMDPSIIVLEEEILIAQEAAKNETKKIAKF